MGYDFIVCVEVCASEFAVAMEDIAGFFDVWDVILFKSFGAYDVGNNVALNNGEASRGGGNKFEALSPILCDDVAELEQSVAAVGPFDAKCFDSHIFANKVLYWGVDGFRPCDGLVGVFAVIFEKVIIAGGVCFAADEGFEWLVIVGAGEGHFLKPGAAGA